VSLRPLTGGVKDVCGVYLPLEKNKLETTEFPPITDKDLGDFHSARLLRDAARLLVRNGAAPIRCMGNLNVRPRPYQFVPLLMALKLDPIRMLIADDVGIGKTIEAALVARELFDRGEIMRMAVVCPPYLCDQWQKELQGKFNLDAKIVRTSTLARLERDLPRQNISVFEHYPHLVISIDFIKSHRRRDAFLLHAPGLIIIDEAHGAARPAGQSVSQQQRHQLIHDLAADQDKHIILVTATPHSGVEESFLSLLGFIKPEFETYDLDSIDQIKRAELARHFIQRQRADVKDWMGASTRFPKRDAYEVSFQLSAEYKELFRDVYHFARGLVKDDESRSKVRQRVRYWAALALLRCLMSSPAAAKAALMARLSKLQEQDVDEEIDYTADIYDPTDMEGTVDIVPSHVIGESEFAFVESEKRKLSSFSKRAQALRGNHDVKIEKAEELVRELVKDGFRPIVFCRFIATADYVAEELKKRLQKEFKSIHVLSVTGSYSEDEREIRIAELSESKHRVLVATDCLSEGINLQGHFDAVIHYDLPWNPNRLEQREGRVDRFGQKSPVVKAIILYGADNPVDGAVLNVLLRKAKKIHKSLGITVPIPVHSESVIDTVMRALFMRSEGSPQMALFDDEVPVIEVHQQWDRAAEREKRSRSLFAQHRIKPDEVEKELEETDAILGSSAVVEGFVLTALQRLNTTIEKNNGYYKIDPNTLQQSIKAKVPGQLPLKISFDQPEHEDVECVTRNHKLPTALSEYLLDVALNPDGERTIAARSSVIRSRDVEIATTLILMRIRFLIKQSQSETSYVAEECLVSGYAGELITANRVSTDEAEQLLNSISPSSNLSTQDQSHWLNESLRNYTGIEVDLASLALDRAQKLSASHERLRKAVKGQKVSVEPLLPVDVLGIMVVLPEPLHDNPTIFNE
jgi:superfamily II DNA or RNA helicase